MLAAALNLLLAAACAAQAGIEYRQRGNRAEGVRAFPVSGLAMELVSFRALYDEPPGAAPPASYRVRFFLDRDRPAHLVLREKFNRYSYWLDKVRPAQPWRAGFGNVFEWPTHEVLALLPDLSLYQLAVMVRIDGDLPSSIERVAPAILYHTQPPSIVSGYEATFLSNATVQLDANIERADGAPAAGALEPRALRSWPAGEPLRFVWDASAAPAGPYRLTLRAKVRENLERFEQVVEFHHQPRVR